MRPLSSHASIGVSALPTLAQPQTLASGQGHAHAAPMRGIDLRRQALRVSGDDAATWLQGQITQDVATADTRQLALGLVVNLQGKVMADAWVDRPGPDSLRLWLRPEDATDIMKHFDKYIMMEDVDLQLEETRTLSFRDAPLSDEDLRSPWAELGCCRYTESLPTASSALTRLALGLALPGVDLPPSSALPQELALQGRAVSFNKGCYQGQEAVVMLEHRGKPPRRLVRLSTQDEVGHAASTELHTSTEPRPIGQRGPAHAAPDGGYWAFGLLKRKHIENDGATALCEAANLDKARGVVTWMIHDVVDADAPVANDWLAAVDALSSR